jgi:peptidyl-prolyl cis-trans isomerase C
MPEQRLCSFDGKNGAAVLASHVMTIGPAALVSAGIVVAGLPQRSRNRTRIPRLLMRLAMLSLLLLAGCSRSCAKAGDTQAGDADVNTRTGVGSLTPEQQQRVLAKVGDRTITLGEFAAALERMDQFERLRYQSSERRKELLDEMINVELLAQEATEKGYDKDPTAEQENRAILRDAVLSELRKNAVKPTEVPEADVRKYYAEHAAEYKDPERRRVSVLVARDTTLAQKLLNDLSAKTTAAQFGALVRDHSVDPTAKANVPVDLVGDLGIVGPPGDARGDNSHVPTEVRVAVFQIADVGGFSEKPVSVNGKAYVVRLSQRLAARTRSYEEAERVIRVKLAQEALLVKERELMESLRKQFPVVISEEALGGVAVNTAIHVDAGPDAHAYAPSAPDGGSHGHH